MSSWVGGIDREIKLDLKKNGLGEIEKSENPQNLSENQELQTFLKNLLKNYWPPETVLLMVKMTFISQNQNLNFVDETINPQRMQNLRPK